MAQSITSAKTSLNQIPALHKWFVKQYNKPQTILDFGCGKYDKGMEYLEEHGHIVWGYDPYHQPEYYNQILLQQDTDYDAILCANVLNVIQDELDIRNALNLISNLSNMAFFSIYEGDKTGIGKETTKGYQRNEKIHEYVKLIKEFYPTVFRQGNIIIAMKENEDEN